MLSDVNYLFYHTLIAVSIKLARDFSCLNFCLCRKWKKESSKRDSQVLDLWLKQLLELSDGAPQSLQYRSSPPDAIIFLPVPR